MVKASNKAWNIDNCCSENSNIYQIHVLSDSVDAHAHASSMEEACRNSAMALNCPSAITVRPDGSESVRYRYPTTFLYLQQGRLSLYPRMRAICHWHMDLEFTRVLKGHMMYFVNGEIVRVDEGEAIFINSRALHYGFSDDGEECDFYCALIHPIRVGAPPEVYRHFILPFIENKDIPFALLRPDDSTGRDIVHQLDRLFEASDDRTLAITALSAFFSIIADLVEREEPRAQNNTASTHQDTTLSAMRAMTDYIQGHYMENITLRDIARAGAVGRSTCGSIFRHNLAQTPMQYTVSMRVHAAAGLLRDTELPMASVAKNTGFSSASYFAKTFNKVMGCTPKAFRNTHD